MISDDSPGLGLTGGKYQAGRARGCLAGDQWAHRHGDTSSPLVLDTLPAHTHRPLPPARRHSGSRHQHLSPPTRLQTADCSQKTGRIILSVCRQKSGQADCLPLPPAFQPDSFYNIFTAKTYRQIEDWNFNLRMFSTISIFVRLIVYIIEMDL